MISQPTWHLPIGRLFRAIIGSKFVPTTIIAIALSGCASTLNIPKPDTGAFHPLPNLEASTVSVPVSIDLTSIFRDIEKAVPAGDKASAAYRVVEKNTLGDVGLRYEIWRNPLQFSARGNTLNVGGRVFYWFELAQNVTKPIIGGSFWQPVGSCGKGEPPREALVGLETRVSWRDDWRLQSKTSVLPTQFPNKCTITFLNIDVTKKVSEAFSDGLIKGAALADSRLAQFANVRGFGETGWKYLLEPIMLDSGIWLVTNPSGAFAGPVRGSGQTVSATVGFTAFPEIVFGDRPEVEPSPLPPLRTSAPAEGFHITIQGELTYDDATRQLARTLVGEHYTIAGHHIEIVDIKVYGGEDMMVVEANLKGDVVGTVYCVGRPDFDAGTNRLIVRDLDYSVDTKNVLVNVADWLSHDDLRNTIAEKAEWYLSDQIASIRETIAKGLNRKFAPNIAMSGSVTAIRPAGLFTTPTSFVARVVADGAVRLDIK
ncbi:MAG: hypothetical protein JWQ98_2568 [Chlorobi bacterium]|nr:hypothetical protein [Chlorobiota bacterium]